MKLYIWFNVLCDYTCGMVAVLANSEEEAKKVVLEGKMIGQDGAVAGTDCVAREVIGDPGPPSAILDEPAGAYVWGGG